MPFFGPIQLGGVGPAEAESALQRHAPGYSGFTSYPDHSLFGFTHPRADLFGGKPPSLTALFGIPVEDVALHGPGESVTGTIAAGGQGLSPMDQFIGGDTPGPPVGPPPGPVGPPGSADPPPGPPVGLGFTPNAPPPALTVTEVHDPQGKDITEGMNQAGKEAVAEGMNDASLDTDAEGGPPGSLGNPGPGIGPGIGNTPGVPSPGNNPSPGQDVGNVGQAGEGGGSGDGSKFICNLMLDHGLMTRPTWAAMLRWHETTGPEVFTGYKRWAGPLTRYARRSPTHFRVLHTLLGWAARAYQKEILCPGSSRVGRVLLRLGVPVCRWLGRA
mgnify:CR=1 FL=1